MDRRQMRLCMGLAVLVVVTHKAGASGKCQFVIERALRGCCYSCVFVWLGAGLCGELTGRWVEALRDAGLGSRALQSNPDQTLTNKIGSGPCSGSSEEEGSTLP